jgi:hypothetical protein
MRISPLLRRALHSCFPAAAVILAVAGLASCSSSNNPPPPPPPPPPPVSTTLHGVVTDGPVIGGTLFLFDAGNVQAALDSIDPDGDRLAALNAAPSIVALTRDPLDGDQYSLMIDNSIAGSAVFFVFDNTEAEDDTFKDTPANLESVAIIGAAGSTQRVNVSLQTTLIAQQVRAALDPDGDGTIITTAEIQTAIDDATTNVLNAFATDALGRDLFPPGFDPISHDDDDAVHAASAAIGILLRAVAHAEDVEFDDIVVAIAGDTSDGSLDGDIPVDLAPTPEQEALAAAVRDVAAAGSDEDIAVFAVGPCSSAAVSLMRACAIDAVDDLLEGSAVCADIFDDDDRADCEADVDVEVAEKEEECDDVFDARLALCEELDDGAHDPLFGPAFAGNFVNPLEIGNTVTPNPWFPLVTGNHWVYANEDEMVDVMVTDETKLIDGITCVVVVDTASEDDVVVEITRDWYAQDISGNVWYCGEISRNFEVFEGDDPETPELVDIDGSWKAGRDGAEPGILLPFAPQVGAVIRQEVAYGEAEDVIRVESLTATESSPVASCNGDCLITTDFTPLEPDVEENKFYVRDVGLIVELEPEDGQRVELVEFSQDL